MKRERLFSIGFVLFATLIASGAEQEHLQPQNPSFDKRRADASNSPTLEGTRALAADRLRARMEGVQIDLDDVVGSPKSIHNRHGFLSGPASAREITHPRLAGEPPDTADNDPQRPIKEFLDENLELFGHGSEILGGARKERDYVTEHNGMRTVVWQQELDGIPVFEAMFYGHITKNGELASLCSLFVPEASKAADAGVPNRATIQLSPPISPQKAVANAATNISETLRAEEVAAADSVPEGTERKQRFTAPPLQGEATANLVWLPMERSKMRLCWRVILTGKTSGELYQVLSDAENGEPQVRHCWTAYLSPASYKIFASDSPSPFSPGHPTPSTTQPPLVSQTFVQNFTALSTVASPNGWINDGDTRTIGNNVDAHLDLFNANPGYGDPLPIGNPPRPDNANRVFDYTWDPLQPPLPADQSQYPNGSPNQNAAVVNAFYWCNWMHDRLYELGFTEAAGNFQQDNFGRGGVGGDPVLVDVQDEAVQDNQHNPPGPPMRNSSNTSVQPGDGAGPNRLLLRLFDGPLSAGAPERDTGLDPEIILHEYTHAMNHRLVGQGVGFDSGNITATMDEGSADFFALSLLGQPGDDLQGNYAFAAYSLWKWLRPGGSTRLEENYYYGFHTYPCSTDLAKNPYTLKDVDPLQAIPHTGVARNPAYNPYDPTSQWFSAGYEMWTATLWEARANMIAKYGYNTGNDLILRLVVDGMKLGPASPNYLQARDAILLADRVNSGGANFNELWAAFKKRGMGWNATCPPGTWAPPGCGPPCPQPDPPVLESFDLPPQGSQVWVYPTSGTVSGIFSSPAVAPDGTIYVGADDGKLYALTPTNGSKIWEFTEASSPPISFRSAPVVGPNGTIYARRSNGYLYAINPNGTLNWKTQVYYDSWVSPALGLDGTVYVAGLDPANGYANCLHAISPQGATLWTFLTGNTIYSSPAIAPDGTLYFGSMDTKVYAVDPSAHLVKNGWPVVTGGGVVSSPAIGRDGTVYVGSYDGKLYALNPNGTAKWPQPFNAGAVIRSSPAIGPDGTIFVGSDNYNLYAIDPNTGLVKAGWPYTTGFSIGSSPAVAGDGTIIFGSDDGKVYALKPDGTSVGSPWPFYTGGVVFSSPVIGVDGLVYVGSGNGKLYALSSVSSLVHSSWPMFRQNPWHTGTPATLTLGSGERLANGNFRFQIHGVAGMVCQVNASHNLISWITIPTAQATVTLTGGTDTFTDLEQNPGFACRFYRVRSGPILSLNSLGYVAVDVPSGSSMIANQLNNPAGNTVAVLLPTAPVGTTLYKWNETSQQYYPANTFAVGWSDPNMTLNPGEGVLVQAGAATTFTFVGDVPQGTLANPLPASLSIRSAMVPQTGPIDSLLGYPNVVGDVINRYNNAAGAYESYTCLGSSWSPLLAPRVGESFWINTGTARTWTRTFTVW